MSEDRRTARSRGGVVTFLFTDLVGSTSTAQKLGDEAAEQLRQIHFALLRKAISGHAGEEVKNLGDGLMVVFTSPVDAAEAAVAIQRAIAEHNIARPGLALSVRIGLHAGEPVREDGDYFGTPVVVASRLCAAAKGGQVLAGELVAALVGSRGGFRFSRIGQMELKGLTEPISAVALEWAGPTNAVADSTRRAAPGRTRRRGPRGPDLVGRDDEIAALDAEYVEAVTDAQFRCVLLSGEAGLGKTRLAGELLSRRAEQATVLRSRAHPMAAGAAFGVWAEALDPLLQLLGDDEVAELCGGFLDDLAGLFHRVAALRGPWSAGPSHEVPRPRLLAGLTRMLDELTARGPVIVLLDDMHWADASSWEVLRQLSRRLYDVPLLIVITARQVELGAHEMAGEVIFELEQDGLLRRLEVTPLSRVGLRALAEQIIGSPPSAALVEWLSERSRGNALFAVGLLRALLEEGADLSAPVLRRLPESLSERVAARARTVPPAELALLELLAVVGRPAHLAELIAWSGSTLETLGELLTQLVSARGVVETERGRSLTYEISHPLVRDAIYDRIGGARRRVLHQQVGRALRQAGHTAEAALHFTRCAEIGDDEAVDALLDALSEAEAREAVREALTLLAALVDVLPADDARWLRVLDALRDRADWVTDHRAETNPAVAVAALRAIDRQLTDTVDPARRALVKFRLAHFLAWGTGDTAEAETFCRASAALFVAAGDAEQERVAERELAWIIGCQGDPRGMLDHAAAATRAAQEAGDPVAEMLAWATVTPAATFLGLLDEATSANARAAELARTLGKPYRATVSANMAAMMLGVEGRRREARAILAEAKLADPSYRETGHLDLESSVGIDTGDFRAALAAARQSAEAAPVARLRRLPGILFGAFAAVELGEADEAQRHLDRADGLLRGRDWQVFLPLSQHAAGLLQWSAGQVDPALTQLRSAAGGLHRMSVAVWAGPALLDLAELAAELGDAGQAAAAVEDLAAVAAGVARDRFHAMHALAEAWSALAAGEPGGSMAAARKALDQLSTVECAILTARAHYVLGRALASSAPGEAAAAFDEAARGFEQCGALWRRGLVLAAMRRTGSSGRRVLAAALGPDSLTRREREVARLAARGLSAKEIGEALFVGERTVESHLSNVYAKFGVASKVDLVRRAGELGLT